LATLTPTEIPMRRLPSIGIPKSNFGYAFWLARMRITSLHTVSIIWTVLIFGFWRIVLVYSGFVAEKWLSPNYKWNAPWIKNYLAIRNFVQQADSINFLEKKTQRWDIIFKTFYFRHLKKIQMYESHSLGPDCERCLTTSTQFQPLGRSSLSIPP
jgi:hypothetical protein